MSETQKSGGAPASEWSDFALTLAKSGLIGLYLTSILFVIGWAYADRYFELFGISLSGLQRNLDNSYYIYALWALRDGWLFLAVSGAALAAVAALLRMYASASKVWRPTALFVIAGLVTASFVAAFWLGQWRAERQAPDLISKHYHEFPRVLVVAKAGASAQTAEFLAARTAGEQKDCLRKLFMDQKNIYLYPGYESFKEGLPPVYVVPLSEVAAIEISKARGLCKP
jgi:hypothetical protein